MGAVFTSPARPFYQSVTLINLAPISMEKYVEFCCRNFKQRGKELLPEVVTDLYERFGGITSYMQKVMNLLFTMTPEGGRCSSNMTEVAIEDLLDLSSDTYET